jgi:hypothetical protein
MTEQPNATPPEAGAAPSVPEHVRTDAEMHVDDVLGESDDPR